MPTDLNPRAVLFDVYLTLIDIQTDEGDAKVWERLAWFLLYRALPVNPIDLRDNYFALIEQSELGSTEHYPEADVAATFERLLRQLKCADAGALSVDVARLFRVLSMVHFDVFPDALPALRRLREHFKLGIVSDAQPIFFWPEVEIAGLVPLLDTVVLSGDHGFRKPDPRLFSIALSRLQLSPAQAIYVGDRIDRDICGAKAAQIPTVLVDRTGQVPQVTGECRPDRTIDNLGSLCDWLIGR